MKNVSEMTYCVLSAAQNLNSIDSISIIIIIIIMILKPCDAVYDRIDAAHT